MNWLFAIPQGGQVLLRIDDTDLARSTKEFEQSIADADAIIRRTATEIDGLFRDQERVRQNISNLNQVTGQQEQVQKYARTLASQESQLATLRDRQNEATQRKASLESELNSVIEKLDF